MAATELERLIVRFDADTARLDRGLNQVERRTRRSSRTMQRSFDGIGRSITGATAALGRMNIVLASLGAGAFGAGSIAQSFLRFDNSLRRVVGLVGVAEREVAGFRQELLEMGPAVGRGPAELAEALFFVTSAGLRGEKALETLRSSALAAKAGLGETSDVAFALVSALNAYEAEGLDAATATDILVKTVREGNLEAASLARSLGRVLPVAQAAGATLNDVGAATAALTRIGFSTQQAIDAIRLILAALSRESAEGEKQLARVGLTFQDIRDTIRREGLLEGLTLLRDAIGNSETALVDIFGEINAVNGVLGLTGERAESVGQIFQSLRQPTGALADALDAVSDSAQDRLDKALASMEASMIRIGSVVLPPLSLALEEVAREIDVVAQAAQFLGSLFPIDELKETEEDVRSLIDAFDDFDRRISNAILGRQLSNEMRGMFGLPQTPSPTEVVIPLPPPLETSPVPEPRPDRTPRLTDEEIEEREKVQERVREFIRALEQEVTLLNTEEESRRRVAAQLELENILRGTGVQLTDEQRQAFDAYLSTIEAVERQTKETAEAEEEWREKQAQARRVIESVRTPLEAYILKVQELHRLLPVLVEELGSVEAAQEVLNRATIQAREEFEFLTDEVTVFERAAEGAAEILAHGLEDAVFEAQSLKEALMSVGEELSRLGFRLFVTEPLEDTLRGALGGRTFEDDRNIFSTEGGLITDPNANQNFLERLFGGTSFGDMIGIGEFREEFPGARAGDLPDANIGELGDAAGSAAAAITGMSGSAQDATAVGLLKVATSAEAAAAALQSVAGTSTTSGFGSALLSGLNLAPLRTPLAEAAAFDVAMNPSIFHKGGIVGRSKVGSRVVPASLFKNAPRLHDGLAPDEFPAILQSGERVIPRSEVNNSTENVTINVNLSGDMSRSRARGLGLAAGQGAAEAFRQASGASRRQS